MATPHVEAQLKAVEYLDGNRIVAADQPREGTDMTQRAFMKKLFLKCHGDRESVVRLYADAEARGDVRRQRNALGLTHIEYAIRLFADGMKKGWLRA